MVNCCKVIVTFIGHRPTRTPSTGTTGKRRFGNHWQDHGDAAGVIAMLKDVYRFEQDIDPGLDMDTILICNGGWPSEADKFITKIDGSRTARGRLRVMKRENTGLSFGGYSYAFEQLRSKYKFWVFTEDDILFTEPNYAADSLKLVRAEQCHYVALIRIDDRHRRPHCYGGVGFTRRAVLDRVAEQFNGRLPYADKKPRIKRDGGFRHHLFCRDGEVALTNTVVQLGMKLGEMPGRTRFYYDWKQSNSGISQPNMPISS